MKSWTPEDRALWARLEALPLDEAGASLPFSARLSRDNNWSREFAQRVMGEYKRFVFLAMRANHPVTPSDEIDQVWHQHLCYTRSYWDQMCGEVLGAPLHHGPTRGGREEGRKFENWYAKTLDSYQEWFGEQPPREIWPPNEMRARNAVHFRRINTRGVWIIKKPRLRLNSPQVGLPKRDWIRVVPLLFALILAGCAGLESDWQSAGPNVFNWHGGPFLGFFWTLSALGLAYGIWRKGAELQPRDAVFPAEPIDAYHVARLRDAKDLAVDVALSALYRKGALEVMPTGTLRATGAPVAVTPFENAVLAQLGASALTPGENSVRSVRLLLKQETARLDAKLRDLGLLVSREVEKKCDNWPLGITLGLLGIGAVKIAVGLSRDRPVGFLFLSCAILVGFGCYFLTHPARRSKRGELFLAHLSRNRFSAQSRNATDFEGMALHMALIGIAAYPPEMQRAMRPPSSGDGGSSGGSGCSSSSSSGGEMAVGAVAEAEDVVGVVAVDFEIPHIAALTPAFVHPSPASGVKACQLLLRNFCKF